MGDEVRQIVQHLNAPPFDKGLTLIKFDALKPFELLQLLNQVFCHLSDENVSLREEAPEDTVARLLAMLRVLKYQPPTDDARVFRQGLIAGEREVIYPILLWCLPRLDEFKNRAYLARFLVRIDVPPDILQNEEVADAHTKYTAVLETFTETHKELRALKTSGFSTADVKKDITLMEQEREQLLRRIERMRKKSEGLPQYAQMLTAARNLRVEHEREDQLVVQREQQENTLQHAELRLQRLVEQLQELQSQRVGGGAQGLLARLEEESQMHRYLAQEKLPRVLEERRNTAAELERVYNEPAMSQADIDAIHRKIQDATAEINRLTEDRMKMNEGGDSQLTLFRQQASMIAHKKAGTADKLRDLEQELGRLKDEVEAARLERKRTGPRMLKADEFKQYVAKLRTQGLRFKAKKSELTSLRAEYTILSRTEELLRSKDQSIQNALADAEAAGGVSGIRDTQADLEKVSAAKSELDELKGKTLDEMSAMVKDLNETIASKKSSLAPLIKLLRTARSEAFDLEKEYREKKAAYEKMSRTVESTQARLDQEVKALREDVHKTESHFHFVQQQLRTIQAQRERAEEERQLYKASHADADRKKPYRDIFQRKISEQETHGRHLRDKQKIVKDSHGENMQQLEMWKDLSRLMECKHQTSAALSRSGTNTEEENRLIL